MMHLVQQMQRDQHDYAHWKDQSMLEFTAGMTEDMRALTLHVEGLHEVVSRVEGQRYEAESSRRGEQARRRYRPRMRCRFRGQGEEE